MELTKIKKLVVATFSDAGQLIENYANEPTMLVGLNFSSDNAAVDNANTVLIGKHFKKPYEMDGQQIWNFNHTAKLFINELDLGKFIFNGQCWSEYLDFKDLDYDLQCPTGTTNEQLIANGFKGFCLRVFLAPETSIAARMCILFYPLCADAMKTEYTMSDDPRFSGIVISRAHINLGLQREEVTD